MHVGSSILNTFHRLLYQGTFLYPQYFVQWLILYANNQAEILIDFGEGINDGIVLDHQKWCNMFLKAGIQVAILFTKMEKVNGRSLLAVQTGEEKQCPTWGRTSAAAVLSLSKLDFASPSGAVVRSFTPKISQECFHYSIYNLGTVRHQLLCSW